ncbi:sigma-70 family RNA polymerase sigma factor [Ruminococcus flavefaciens]|uniref:RNA polymerase sigma-70 factor (ECF subfamily) n=1 Tax=Ruminococcus flavefaciens TaxID=1265 RepID=A0A315XVE9_RUMFL|nr:sigma-70 family RNA polymerase sigma factor [Ruminococcus flavefaciens]PWJ11088.1 RNA polymerase sigma-70 factor (ECF subfamily) [Ruminococcus flavefaciens]SSA51162.1 RNA polymerase sigma-70 factor, ECF subfamily [Ruminococcus flavefaciens]
MTDMELRMLMAESVQKCHRVVFEKYCNYVYAIVINILRNCGSREDIEDCVSDVFFKLYKQLDANTDFSGDLKGFIAAVSRNTAIDAFRRLSNKNNRSVYIDDDTTEELRSDERIEENAEKAERSRLLLGKIKELGEPDTTIIIQQYFYNRTAKEIAKSISMTAAAVQKRSSRARQKLKALLCEAGIGKEDLI